MSHKILWYLGFVLSLGGAIFSKSLVGLAIPACAIFVWLAVDDFWLHRKFRLERWLWLFTASALAFVPVSIWVLAVFSRYGSGAVYMLVWTNNFGRFIGSGGEHVEPFYYYLLKLPAQFQPWTFFLPFAIIYHGWRTWRNRDEKSLLLLCWAGFIPYLLLALSAGKRQVYVLPLYPAEALLSGSLVAALLEDKIKLKVPERIIWLDWLVRAFSWIFCAGLLISPLVFAGFAVFGGLGWSSYLTAALLLGCGFWLLWALRRQRQNQAGLAMLAGLALVFVNIDANVYNFLDRKYAYRPLFEYCQTQIDTGKNLYLYLPDERISGGSIFYLGKKIPAVRSGEIETFRKSSGAGNVFFLTEDKNLKSLKNIKVLAVFKIKHIKLYLFSLKPQETLVDCHERIFISVSEVGSLTQV